MGGYPGSAATPTTAEMVAWIAEVVDQGIRRPGYPADEWVERWGAERFTEIGLRDVRLEPVETTCWLPRAHATLRVWPAGRPEAAVDFTGLALPFTAPTEGTEGTLAAMAGESDVSGRFAVQEITLTTIPQAHMATKATASYDPEGAFADSFQTLPLDLVNGLGFDAAIAAGATAYVGLLTGAPWETHDYYWPYDATARPIPGLWLSPSDGRRLLELMAAGEHEARIVSDAEIVQRTTHNVIGTLPGASDHWVVVATHHDAPWASAVEDGSGIALVLAQAKLWASVPAEQRPHNLMFLLTTGHMARAAGTEAFVRDHADLLPELVLELHLEHAARRCVVQDGALVPTADPETRWWFTTRSPELEKNVLDALQGEDVGRSWILPPTALGPMPLTDGAFFHPAGVPLVQFITLPMYLFDPADTMDKVHEASLEPLTRAVARIVQGTEGVKPDGFRPAD
ncbi:hypothetical protein GCM10023170_083670 [Phytohabitans houttuyneae]